MPVPAVLVPSRCGSERVAERWSWGFSHVWQRPLVTRVKRMVPRRSVVLLLLLRLLWLLMLLWRRRRWVN